MRKTLFIYCWLVAPVALLAYHYGPGQAELARDSAAKKITEASALVSSENWTGAVSAYDEALQGLPATDTTARWQVRLAKAKARMHVGEIPEAKADFEGLLTEMQKDGGSPELIDDARVHLGMAGYYAGWLMRLEGAPTAEWTAEVEDARQNFRLLAENKLASGSAESREMLENLEATIRLARMDLSELQGLPLPKTCQGCKNVSQKCRGQCQSKAKKPGEKKPKDARGAGTGERSRGGS